jgi:hypothetical protein
MPILPAIPEPKGGVEPANIWLVLKFAPGISKKFVPGTPVTGIGAAAGIVEEACIGLKAVLGGKLKPGVAACAPRLKLLAAAGLNILASGRRLVMPGVVAA